MARAVGGDPKFIGAEVAITDLVTKWFGEFEANVDRVWDGARQLRRASGDTKLVFLLMDEFDSFFSNSEGHWVDTTYARVQKALQMKLDGVVDYEGIITLGLTNEPAKIPLSIYRRFKYVDIVGELEPVERSDLLKHFLTAGLPLSHGFTGAHYQHWGELLDGATGDVIGKVADDIHYEYMRKFLHDNSRLARSLNRRVLRMTAKDGEVDKPELKRTLGQYLTVDPDWVEAKVREKISDPVIKEQISTAQRVYADARHILDSINGAHRPAKTVGFNVTGARQEPYLAQSVATPSGSTDDPGIDYAKRRT
jgi:SpoVK/Ycf46/Vps4 family AAA+-type ATPase